MAASRSCCDMQPRWRRTCIARRSFRSNPPLRRCSSLKRGRGATTCAPPGRGQAGGGPGPAGGAGGLRPSRTRGCATPMNPALVSPTREDEQGILRATLRQVRGPDVWLEDWSAQPLTKHGKQRVVRYDLRARAALGREVCSLQWVGKFYEDDGAARRVAAVLRSEEHT